MPVVFTSALGFEQDNFLARRNLLKPVWGISQTPQVWLDHQVYESEGELRFNWDFVAALFPSGRWNASLNSIARCLTEWPRMKAPGSCRSPTWFPRLRSRSDAPAGCALSALSRGSRRTSAASA
jgi:hypothetical protein